MTKLSNCPFCFGSLQIPILLFNTIKSQSCSCSHKPYITYDYNSNLDYFHFYINHVIMVQFNFTKSVHIYKYFDNFEHSIIRIHWFPPDFSCIQNTISTINQFLLLS